MIGRLLPVLFPAVLLALSLGCASVSPEEQARRNRVLTDYQSALTALRAGNDAQAKSLLDSALVTLGGSSAGDASARESRGYFNPESTKTFRGEPYERAMAYYYRGILYWMDGEPDNARAAFRSAAVGSGSLARSGSFEPASRPRRIQPPTMRESDPPGAFLVERTTNGYFRYFPSQPRTSPYQNFPLSPFRTQWFSSGK